MALLIRNPCTRLLVIVLFSFTIMIENSSCFSHKNPNSPLEKLNGKTSTLHETCSVIIAVTIRPDLTIPYHLVTAHPQNRNYILQAILYIHIMVYWSSNPGT